MGTDVPGLRDALEKGPTQEDLNSALQKAAGLGRSEMVELLQTHYGYGVGRELHWVEDPMGEHDEDTWGRRFPAMLVALLGSR